MGEFIEIMDTSILSDSDYKKYRYDEIDNRTGQLILEGGFEYPASSGKIFSFSENAQRNILGMFAAKDVNTYPVAWNVKDDSETYNIVDAADLTNFFLTALGTKKAHQDSGSALKNSVRDAVDRNATEAIIDNR